MILKIDLLISLRNCLNTCSREPERYSDFQKHWDSSVLNPARDLYVKFGFNQCIHHQINENNIIKTYMFYTYMCVYACERHLYMKYYLAINQNETLAFASKCVQLEHILLSVVYSFFLHSHWNPFYFLNFLFGKILSFLLKSKFKISQKTLK